MNITEKLLIDTDVFIDFLRGHEPALTFMQQVNLTLSVSAMTVAELFAGVREGQESKLLENALKVCAKIEIDTEIATLGGLYRRDYGKSHGVGLVGSDAIWVMGLNLRGLKDLGGLGKLDEQPVLNYHPHCITTGLVDALIVATAKLHGYRLVTLNHKHFPMLDKVLVPYYKS